MIFPVAVMLEDFIFSKLSAAAKRKTAELPSRSDKPCVVVSVSNELPPGPPEIVPPLWTVMLPPSVPEPRRVPPFCTVTLPVAAVLLPLMISKPAATVVSPV